jgi:poly(hydroxyalkanoate) depolymerase family esterase
MSIDFMAAMRRATDATRTLDVTGATRIIREALGGRAAALEPTEAQSAPRAGGRVHPEVEDAEVVEPSPPPRSAERRRPLREVVRLLREGRGSIPGFAEPRAPCPAAPPAVPEGASFELRRHACAAGSRAYRVYVPATAGQGVEGLLVMLHGCTQTPEDFATGTGMNALAERHRLVVAYPAQAAIHNPNACWNWFRPEDQARGAGEPAIIAGLTEALAAEFEVLPGRVFVAGLSAGGAMAAVMGETYPELYAAVGVHSGLAPGAARDVASAFAAMRRAPATAAPARTGGPRLIVFHGDADKTVHPSNATQVLARATGSGAATERARTGANGSRIATRTVVRGADGRTQAELWMVEGAGHAWSGGDGAGSYTDPSGPDASAEMVRFFMQP